MFLFNKFQFFHQNESVDCGPACLAMICSHYGVKCTVNDLKKLCSITRMGVSVQDIVEGGTKIGFETAAYKVQISDLEELPLLAILFWRQEHFVVLRKIKFKKGKKIFYISDPSYGNIHIEEDVFINEWIGNNLKGVVILFQQTEKPLNIPKISTSNSEEKELLSNIFSYFVNNKIKYILALLLLVVGFVTNWVSPIIFKRILDEGILAKSISTVNILLIAQLVFFLSSFISEFFSEIMLTKINFYLNVKLKENFLKKLMLLPISYFDTRLNTDTLERISDQEKVKNFITWKGLTLLVTVCNLVVFSIMLYYSNTEVFLIYLFLSLISILWVGVFLKKRATLEYSLFLKQSENSNSTYEFIMNMPEIKTQNAQSSIIKNIIAIQHKLNNLELQSFFLNIYQMIGVGFLSKLKEIAALCLCAYLIINDQMTVGSLLAISYILGQLTSPVQNLINFIRDAQDAKIAYNRLSDVYNEPNECSQELAPPIQINEIKLSDVSFKYPGSFNPFVLENINFSIISQKTTAIVGQSGSGKTTLLKLLLRHHKTTSGAIMMNDVDINSINPDLWRKRCGVVSQDGNIFSGTIAFNIALSDENPDYEKIRKAAQIACIDEFIMSLPMEYSTKVGNIGIQLSGGQKQRLLIARAIYRDPEFIFFDEATSSLDSSNELQIYNNLNLFFKGKTVFIIAHRLSTVKNADQIIVLESGKIVEIGKHQELVNRKGKYFNLVKNQLELGE